MARSDRELPAVFLFSGLQDLSALFPTQHRACAPVTHTFPPPPSFPWVPWALLGFALGYAVGTNSPTPRGTKALSITGCEACRSLRSALRLLHSGTQAEGAARGLPVAEARESQGGLQDDFEFQKV